MKEPVSDFCKDFVSRIEFSLKQIVSGQKILLSDIKAFGVAVSGGADSIALLTALSYIAENNNFSLEVITVNHRIRPDSESASDTALVEKYSADLKSKGFSVNCTVVDLGKNQVQNLAKLRGRGIEEAARVLRYESFERFIFEKKLPFLCTAHNKNDEVETCLMRFLQGSTGKGISSVNGKIIRPLLDISRSDIEKFLSEQNISYCTDSTNSDNGYLRNRIRNVLIPVLDKEFSGWQKAVVTGSQKHSRDEELLEEIVSKKMESVCTVKTEELLACFGKEIYYEPVSMQTRMIFSAFRKLGVTERVPYEFVERVCNLSAGEKLTGFGIEIEKSAAALTVKKIKNYSNVATESGYFVIIERTGEYSFSWGKIRVQISETEKNKYSVSLESGGKCSKQCEVLLPCVVRCHEIGDEVLCSDGNYKAVSDVFSDWKINEELRKRIPLIEEFFPEPEIKGIMASVFGYEDWIVKKY